MSNCDKFGHKGSQCRNWKNIKNRVRHTKSKDETKKVVRKYITVKVRNKSVIFQVDSGSDTSIINLQTWRKLNKPIIEMTNKTTQTVTRDKIKFQDEIIIPVSLNGITKKLKVFILKNTENLFGSDWFLKFKHSDLKKRLKKKILTSLLRSKMLVGGVLWEPYLSHHNGLFSPLLLLRDFAARRQINHGLTPLHVSGSTSAGRVICGTHLAECVSVPGDFLRPQGAFPSGFYPLSRGVGFIARRLRRL